MKRLLVSSFLIFVIFAISACAAVVRDGGEIRLFGPDEDNPPPPIVSIENEYLILEFFTQSLEIVVTERATGLQWRSSPENAAGMPGATVVAQAHMQSLFLLEHENEIARSETFDAHRMTRQTGRFEHAIVDGGLELYFTVGDIPDTFHIPYAIYAERLYSFVNNLPDDARRQVIDSYQLRRYDRLRAGTERDDLLAQFQQLAPPEPGEPGAHIYVLRDTLRPHLRRRVEEYLQSVGYDRYEWMEDQAHFGLVTEITRPVFNLTFRYELHGNEMVLTIPFDEINFLPEFLPTRLTVMPFFGAGGPNDEGYLFVPDGSGALINFNSGRGNQDLYINNVFGRDEAVVPVAVMHNDRASYPVFGIHRNGGTFVAIIEEGSAYATIRAGAGGTLLLGPYSTVHSSFRLFHGAPMDLAGLSSQPFMMHEHQLAPGEQIVIRYIFTEQPGYVGMAVAYREFLQSRYPWLNQRVSQPVNAMVEILGAAEARQHILGFPVDRPFPLTTFDQASTMMNTLSGFGWHNVPVMMRGAHNNSIDHSVPSSMSLVSQLGNRRAFDNMLDTANNLGFDFYIEADFVHMRDISMFDGFSRNRNAARQVNRQRVEHNTFSYLFYTEYGNAGILAAPIVLANPAFTVSSATNFVNDARSRGVNNIAFRSMANALGGDFHHNRHVSREASMNMRVDLLYDLREQGTNIWLNHGFSFAVPFANVITGMPISDQGTNITCVSVPFYQIALHGLIPFAGQPLNLAEDYSYHLLRSIESGASLFFSFMHVPTADLEVTRYRRYFANEFSRWIETANNLYQNYANYMGHLYNQLIMDHQILANGVSVTIFEDGTRVYVNVSMADSQQGSVVVPARNYTVVR